MGRKPRKTWLHDGIIDAHVRAGLSLKRVGRLECQPRVACAWLSDAGGWPGRRGSYGSPDGSCPASVGGPVQGSSTMNVEPAPSSLRTRMLPPCASAIRRLM